ncbi:hypothetical protein MOQ_002322 [Trypanosoma cruzi marinkellei]|uniref:Axoneme central apparatus protein n=1 Tax=Trypanosoma cruzi marinkellei TaxID=85056 RepID=K2N890_TRYCR|nr:hypothetical protein MOQ_002322 [Trypanosoma cruzi marinkellei]
MSRMGSPQRNNCSHKAVYDLPEKALVDPVCSSASPGMRYKGLESGRPFQGEARSDLSSSENLELSSLTSEEPCALPATVLIGGASRCVGAVSPGEYETMEGEDEESESSSSLDNSGEYAPLGFSVVAGGPLRALYKPKTVSYSVDESEDSNTELSFSDAPLVMTVQDNRGQASVQRQKERNIEVLECKPEAEAKEDFEEQGQLNAVVIRNLVRRLRDPNVQVAASEFENLEWDDPNFEEELRTLKQIASYTEVKETMMKTAKDGILESSSLIDQKIKDAVMMLPEITVVGVKGKFVEQVGTFGALNKIGQEFVSPSSPKKSLLGAPREKIIMVGNNGKVAVLSKEAYAGSRFAGKKKMTESMIFAAGGAEAAISSKESHVGSCNVEKKKRKDHLLTSQNFTIIPKEAAFGEEEKPTRRKRREDLGRKSIVIYDIPELVNGEIVETEYMDTEDARNETKDEENETRRRSRNKETTRRSRGWSVMKEVLPDEAQNGYAVNEKEALLSKKGRVPATRRRRNNNKNRSITFAELLEVEGEEVPLEALGAHTISLPLSTNPHEKAFLGNKTAQCGVGNDAVQGGSLLSNTPGDTTETIVGNEQATNTPLASAQVSSQDSCKKRNSVDALQHLVEKDVTGVVERANDGKLQQKKKKRYRPVSDRQKSRELEYSLVVNDEGTEIAESEDALGLNDGRARTISRLREKHSFDSQEATKDPNCKGLPPLGSATSWRHRVRSKRSLNASFSVTELLEPAVSEIPDTTMDPSKVAKMSNQGEPALGVTHNARKVRRARSNNLNRSATSFVFVPDEEVVELKEKVEENLDQTISRGNTLNEGILLPALSRPHRRKHSSAAGSMASLDIAEVSTMEFNLDDILQSSLNRRGSE